MDLSKNNQYDSRSETVVIGRKLHTATEWSKNTMYITLSVDVSSLSVALYVELSMISSFDCPSQTSSIPKFVVSKTSLPILFKLRLESEKSEKTKNVIDRMTQTTLYRWYSCLRSMSMSFD